MLLNEFQYMDIDIGDSVTLKAGVIQFYKDKITVIHGPNGCGKSSMMYEMADLRRNYVKGPSSRWSKIWEKIGLVDQQYEKSLFPWLSVDENKYFYNSNNNSNNYSYEKLISDFKKDHKKIKSLSGGMKQRLAIIKELGIGNGNLLLLDEPFSNQHPSYKKNIINILSNYVKNNGAVLLITHEDFDTEYLNVHSYEWRLTESTSNKLCFDIIMV
jgi:NitT/TauT family transport system ATP-binding protein